MNIHHIGYLVKDISAAQGVLAQLGYQLSDINTTVHRDLFRMIDILFVEKDGYQIELIAPCSKESSFFPLLKKFKNCAYHICYESTNIDEDVAKLNNSGWRQITQFDPASALGERRVGFFLHPKLGMIELIDMCDC